MLSSLLSNCSTVFPSHLRQVEEEFEIDLNDNEPDFLKGQTTKTGADAGSLLPAAAALHAPMACHNAARPRPPPVHPSHQSTLVRCLLLFPIVSLSSLQASR